MNSDTDILVHLLDILDRLVVFKPDCASESPGELLFIYLFFGCGRPLLLFMGFL